MKKTINSTIANENFKFYTDNGVFSKESVDFGTKTMLESFSTEKVNAQVADIGCGYGVISIFLAKKYPTFKFTMVDVNNRVLELSRKNIELNKNRKWSRSTRKVVPLIMLKGTLI